MIVLLQKQEMKVPEIRPHYYEGRVSCEERKASVGAPIPFLKWRLECRRIPAV